MILTIEERDAILNRGLEKICADEFSHDGRCMVNGQLAQTGKYGSCIYYDKVDKIDYCTVEVEENG